MVLAAGMNSRTRTRRISDGEGRSTGQVTER